MDPTSDSFVLRERDISSLWKPRYSLPRRAVDYIQEGHPEITAEQIQEIYRVIYPFALESAIREAKTTIHQDLADSQGKTELSTRLLKAYLTRSLAVMPRLIRHHLQEINKLHDRLFGVIGGDT